MQMLQRSWGLASGPRWGGVWVLAGVLLAAPAAAWATSLRVDVSATVTSIDLGSPPSSLVGETVQLSFGYDSSEAPVSSGSGTASYEPAPPGAATLSSSFLGFAAANDGSEAGPLGLSGPYAIDLTASTGGDQLSVTAIRRDAAPLYDSRDSFVGVVLSLSGPAGALGGTALPTSLDLVDFTPTMAIFGTAEDLDLFTLDDNWVLGLSVDSLTVSVVPEPATGSLALLGAALAAARARRA